MKMGELEYLRHCFWAIFGAEKPFSGVSLTWGLLGSIFSQPPRVTRQIEPTDDTLTRCLSHPRLVGGGCFLRKVEKLKSGRVEENNTAFGCSPIDSCRNLFNSSTL